MGFGSRLKEARMAHGMSRDRLADIVGVTRSAISNYENEISHPKESIIYKLMSALNVDANFLFQDNAPSITSSSLTPQGEKIGKAYEKAPQREQGIVEQVLEPYIDEEEEDCINLPLYDEPAAAGVGSYLDVGHYEEYSFPSSIVPHLTDYCVRIAGDSMEPDIPHGSVVFVQASPVVENGEVGIFLLGNHSYCKRLLIEQEEKKILLTSDNPKYDDIEIDATDSFNTLGKVLGVYDED